MLSSLGEWSGLFDVLAPRQATEANTVDPTDSPATIAEPQNSDAHAEADSNDNRIAAALQSQEQSENQATAANTFAQYQRALYFHKARNMHLECCVVDVHTDDSGDEPYYTIQYHDNILPTDQEQSGKPVEKQTTQNRLQHVPWNQEKTLALLQRYKKL